MTARAAMQTGKADDDAEVRARLRELAEKTKQAEIAAKTGVNAANVSRYLKDNRIPASFCSALVRGMGVNPAWLMVGEGSAMLSDVTDGTGRMAGNVLQLVEAMNSVTKLRLGSLAG